MKPCTLYERWYAYDPMIRLWFFRILSPSTVWVLPQSIPTKGRFFTKFVPIEGMVHFSVLTKGTLLRNTVPAKGIMRNTIPTKGILLRHIGPSKGMFFRNIVPVKGKGFTGTYA